MTFGGVSRIVRAESAILGLTATDRVYGGFSLSFDMSVETMCTGWFAGAEVVCASDAPALGGTDTAGAGLNPSIRMPCSAGLYSVALAAVSHAASRQANAMAAPA
jgi:hypothetical protein